MSQPFPTQENQGDAGDQQQGLQNFARNPYDNRADIIDKIRPDTFCEKVFHLLMGEEKINGRWVIVNKEKALTQEGARSIAMMMESSSSQNIVMSNLDDKDIRKMVMRNVRDVMIVCLDNAYAYGINSPDQIYFIKNIIVNNTLATAKQAEFGSMRNGLLRTQLEMRSYQNIDCQ